MQHKYSMCCPVAKHVLSSPKCPFPSNEKRSIDPIRFHIIFGCEKSSISFWEDFFKPKIMYPNMTKYLPFYYDEKGFFQNDKSFMITGKHVSYLTAFLNSSLFKVCYKDNFPELLGGTRELRKIFFDKIPVKQVSDIEDEKFRILVDAIQQEYDKSKAIAIDAMIFDLYNLNDQERQTIGFVEIE